MQVSMVSLSKQCINISTILDGKHMLISFIYAKCQYGERRSLGNELLSFNLGNGPWMVLGDFNII